MQEVIAVSGLSNTEIADKTGMMSHETEASPIAFGLGRGGSRQTKSKLSIMSVLSAANGAGQEESRASDMI